MLTALRRKVKSCLLHCLVNATKHHLCQLRTGKAADSRTGHLAGGAAHHQNLILLRLCNLNQFLCCPVCLFSDNCHILCHILILFIKF